MFRLIAAALFLLFSVVACDTSYVVKASGFVGTLVIKVVEPDGKETEYTLEAKARTENPYVNSSEKIDQDDQVTASVKTQPTGYVCTLAEPKPTAKAGVIATCTPDSMTLFATSSAVTGGFGGRTQADSLCETGKTTLGLTCTKVRAFLSVTSSDEIRDMPSVYAVPTDRKIVYQSTGAVLAQDWASLLDGNIENAVSVDWWSGSNSSGAATFTCVGWTDALDSGQYGLAGSTSDTWIANPDGCGSSRKLLCLCF